MQAWPLVQSARKVYLLADASKLNHKSFARFARLDQIHTLITDRQAPSAAVAQNRERGVSVELA